MTGAEGVLPKMSDNDVKGGGRKEKSLILPFKASMNESTITHTNSTFNKQIKRNNNTSLAAKGALAYRLQCRTACNALPPAMPHHLQNPKWPPGGPKMANRVWKSIYP